MHPLLGLFAPALIVLLWWRLEARRGSTHVDRLWSGMPNDEAYSREIRQTYSRLASEQGYWPRLLIGGAIFAAGLVVVAAVAFPVTLIFLQSSEAAMVAAVTSMFTVVVILPMEADVAYQRSRLHSMLSGPHCGGCGYSLDRLPVDDGFKVCPECGLERFVSGPSIPSATHPPA